MSYLIDEVVQRLAEFDDFREIAAQFIILGIKGEPDTIHACPIARLIEGVGASKKIRVESKFVSVDDGPLIELPQAARRFIAAFDDYAFPDILTDLARATWELNQLRRRSMVIQS